MEHPSNPRYISRDQKCIGAAKRNAPIQTRQGTKLRDILMSHKPDVSSVNSHHKLTRDPDEAISKSLGHQNFEIIGVTPKEDELVRYMSNLPSYLAKGNTFSDKALNFGVLDWKRLEKWQYKQKLMSQKHNGCSPSGSSTTVFSTDGSSTYSSRGQSRSPSHQREEKSLDPLGCAALGSQDVDAFRGNHRKFEDCVSSDKQKRRERRKSDVKSASEMEQCPATWKGKTKIVSGEFTRQPRDVPIFEIEVDDQCDNRCSRGATSASTVNGQRRSISGKNDSKSSPLCQTDIKDCEPTVSCSHNKESSKDAFHASHILSHSSEMFQSPSRIRSRGVEGSSKASQKSTSPVRTRTNPSRSRNIEEKPFDKSDGRKSSESVLKARNSSPIRRLSFTMGKIVKNVGTRDISPLCRSTSKDCVVKSGSDIVTSKDCVVKSGSDSTISASDNPYSNQSSNNRSRSSPLRRLLDPILKSRVTDSSEPSKRPPSTIGTIKSCNDNQNSKHGTSSLEALMQVSFKNGFPLFTFTIDEKNNILAATVRKSFVPGKGYHNWTYTFFTVHQVKRKSGMWLNHGDKSNNAGYGPNVVAQMKVSDSPESPDDYITREFDLFAVDVGNGDNYTTDFNPTNELAAIIVQLPRNSRGDDLKDGQSSYNWFNGTDDDSENCKSVRSRSLSATVVLPGGVHTVPSKGEISRLAQRWRSGGSCDCGGWDLGCQLRVYANQRAYNEGSFLNQDKFQIFSQGGQDNEPTLTLTPFKEKKYSVKFNSSLSLLQAFAICISFIDCRRPLEVADPINIVDKLENEIGVFEVPLLIKTSNHQVGAPARYISYPPNSPVGRV